MSIMQPRELLQEEIYIYPQGSELLQHKRSEILYTLVKHEIKELSDNIKEYIAYDQSS